MNEVDLGEVLLAFRGRKSSIRSAGEDQFLTAFAWPVSLITSTDF
jgi:hypothetical protein